MKRFVDAALNRCERRWRFFQDSSEPNMMALASKIQETQKCSDLKTQLLTVVERGEDEVAAVNKDSELSRIVRDDLKDTLSSQLMRMR